MDFDERIKWIDNASCHDLIQKTRSEPIGSPWFAGSVGTHFNRTLIKLKLYDWAEREGVKLWHS